MRSAPVRIDESRVEVELIDLVKIRPEALGWHFRYPQEGSASCVHLISHAPQTAGSATVTVSGSPLFIGHPLQRCAVQTIDQIVHRFCAD